MTNIYHCVDFSFVQLIGKIVRDIRKYAYQIKTLFYSNFDAIVEEQSSSAIVSN